MRVALWYNNKDIRIEERPVPKLGAGELLIRLKAAGICGTDVMEWYRIDRAPLVLGHEVAGEIAEVGRGVAGYKVGDRIAAAHHVPCNTCHYCLSGHETVCDTLRLTNFDPGGFAEYIRLPAINVDRGIYKLPASLSYEEATFIEPLACVYRGQRLAGFKPGQSVLILGSGISGLLHLKLAIALGAGAVITTDVSDDRLAAARRFGADTVFKADKCSPVSFRSANNGRLADLVIICAAAPGVIGQALNMVKRGGTILFFAAAAPNTKIDMSVNDIFWRREIKLLSSYAGSRADHTTALELLRSGRVKVADMITDRIKLGEIANGFKLVAEAGPSLKVIINP